MRTQDEYNKIVVLYKKGMNNCAISKQLNIPRTTVRDMISNPLYIKSPFVIPVNNNDFRKIYSYFLGVFLGDGCLSLHKKSVYRCRITLDVKYPNIITKTKLCIESIMQNNKVSIVNRLRQGKPSCVDVSCYSKEWVKLLPFYKPGPKWKYKIQLEDWQQSIIKEYPKEFWLGLYHSDGCRYKQTNCNSYYYCFAQKSEDITNLFTWCSDLLNIKYRILRRPNINIITITDKISRQKLDTFAGPKI